jgi:hypothetical protein
MAGYFAVLSDFRSLLNLHKGADLGPVADAAPIQVHEVRLEDPHVAAQGHVRSDHSGPRVPVMRFPALSTASGKRMLGAVFMAGMVPKFVSF